MREVERTGEGGWQGSLSGVGVVSGVERGELVQYEPGVRGADSEGLVDQGIVDVAGDGEGFHPAAGKLDLVGVVGVVDGHDQVAVAG